MLSVGANAVRDDLHQTGAHEYNMAAMQMLPVKISPLGVSAVVAFGLSSACLHCVRSPVEPTGSCRCGWLVLEAMIQEDRHGAQCCTTNWKLEKIHFKLIILRRFGFFVWRLLKYCFRFFNWFHSSLLYFFHLIAANFVWKNFFF